MSFSSDKGAIESQLAVSVDIPEDPEEFKEWLNNTFQKIAHSVNGKEGGLYVPEEKITSQQYFDADDPQKNKNVYRMTVDFGVLPNSGLKSVAHDIDWTNTYKLSRAYGGSTNGSMESLSIPNDGICLTVDATNVNITTTSNFSNYEFTTVVIEYTK